MEQHSAQTLTSEKLRTAISAFLSLAVAGVIFILTAGASGAADGPNTSSPPVRPSWLPARFSAEPQLSAPEHEHVSGLIYASHDGDILILARGAANACEQIRSQEVVMVNGNPGSLILRDCAPRIEVQWAVNGQVYSIRSGNLNGQAGVTRDEMLRIVEGLQPADAASRTNIAAQTVDEVTGQFELKLALLAVMAAALIVLERPHLLQRLAIIRR